MFSVLCSITELSIRNKIQGVKNSMIDKLIAVVDDEPDILELVSIHLNKTGFKVKGFLSAEAFLEFLTSQMQTQNRIPNLIILDLMLPDADGFEICKYLKKEENFSLIPVIMLTARDTETDKVLGLELGADDYVTKPFSPRELVARVKAVLRRKVEKENIQKIEIGNILFIDLQKYEVIVENKKIVITMHNITEIKNLEKIKKEFVTNVSHELRTPLTAIKGFIETLAESIDEKKPTLFRNY